MCVYVFLYDIYSELSVLHRVVKYVNRLNVLWLLHLAAEHK